MDNKKALLMTLILILMLLFLSICGLLGFYSSNRSSKMIYKLKQNESVKEVAERFEVNPEDIKVDGEYLMFEIK